MMYIDFFFFNCKNVEYYNEKLPTSSSDRSILTATNTYFLYPKQKLDTILANTN